MAHLWRVVGQCACGFYGETHPERALGFVLRGIFTGQQHEYEHLFYGMQKTFPEAWEELVQAIPEAKKR